jgi:predicted amidohydrolase
MSEREEELSEIVYNSAVTATPEGELITHRKSHICPPESNWANKGKQATVIDTKWGPVGIGISS